MSVEKLLREAFRFCPLLLVGIVLFYVSTHWGEGDIWRNITRDLGVSVVVAYIIIITIEFRQRNELSQSINKFLDATNIRILQSVLGLEFPENMYDFVRDTVMRGSFYKKEVRVNYCIRRKEDGTGVSVELDSSSEVENLTGKTQEYIYRMSIERDMSMSAEEQKKAPGVELYIEGKKVSEKDLSQADDKWEDTGDTIRFAHSITIEARKSVSIRFKHTERTKLISDTEVWRSVHPCSGADFSINFPIGFKVGVAALHADGYETVFKSETVISGRIRRPLFPQNGFMFWWVGAPSLPPEPVPTPAPTRGKRH